MELNSVLKNFTDYVDLGVRLLLTRKTLHNSGLAYYVENVYDVDEIIGETLKVYDEDDVLDCLSGESVLEYAKNHCELEKLLDEYSREDFLEYVRNNFEIDDLVSIDWNWY